MGALRARALDAGEIPDLYDGFDRLSHGCIVLLVETYHRLSHERWERREQRLLEGVARRESERHLRTGPGPLVGAGPAMQRVYEQREPAARSRDTVPLVGVTGTGKEPAARTIHALPGDPLDRFIPVNCAAISHELVESELFGHRRGAFSGAHAEHRGLFRAADGGPLFLDEITELPPRAQAKLLRALRERAVRPVGGLSEIPVTARVIASTNRDAARLLEAGGLRRDPYDRLRQLVVGLPDLAERACDMPLLVEHYAAQVAQDGLGRRPPRFDPRALERLQAHAWPDNVYELQSVLRLACRTAGGGVIHAGDLPRQLLQAEEAAGPREEPSTAPKPAGAGVAPSSPPGPLSIRQAERETIARARKAAKGNKSLAARLPGISRKQLYVKLRRQGLGGVRRPP